MREPVLYCWRSKARAGETTTHQCWPERAFLPMRILAWRPDAVAQLLSLHIGRSPQLLRPTPLLAFTRELMPPLDRMIECSQLTGAADLCFRLSKVPQLYLEWLRAVSFQLELTAASPLSSVELVVRGHVEAIALLGEELV